MSAIVDTDVLIVGAGLSGAALASFLGQNGMRGLVISKESHTAYTPRAHGFNPFALDKVLRLAIREPFILSSRFAKSLVGEEYGRISAWEENPTSLIIQPDRALFPGIVAHLRAVRPWNEWVLAAFGPQGGNPFEGMTTQSLELVDLIRQLVGDDSLDVEILTLDAWTVRESVAETYSKDGQNLFLLGDAAHRHPPTFGLGSNTCIQDAYNLAWKVAYVSKGWAGPGLLSSYSQERQPIGADLVRESNNHIRKNAELFPHATPEGSTRRADLHVALEEKKQEFESLGLAHNHFYVSKAVYLDDEPSPRPELQGDPVVEVQISTYPGSRLPHAWIDKPNRLGMISTLDLAGKGSFCLLVGVDGSEWRKAAEAVMTATGIPIKVFGIGPGQEYIDVYRRWYEKRGVSDSGCVLVRPDRFVAWRSVGQPADCEQKLGDVLRSILYRDEF
ncbi:hypothetical protein H9Q70_011129 [Fusarium xylarioides]|nr:hypothetical protein H9Q70_011129 [Fusarium xylarioides]